jgi:hypothetical protein|tara:strand:+ start:5705 stop:6970 length:1266 start_codon:yes stop_codon:yes gene_type:complete
MKKRILMVAFEFPPSNGASVQRILSFYRHFIDSGWDVDVLTVDPRAYANTAKGSDADLPMSENGHWIRPRAYDVQRDLAWRGKYIGSMMTPDRWGLTWIPNALMAINKHIKKYKPDVIWSSAPIPSTHYIAGKIATKTGVPWVADYRDPMPYLHRPQTKWLNWIHKKIDSMVIKNASYLTYATEGNQGLYISEFNNDKVKEKSEVIANGFSEMNFKNLPSPLPESIIFNKDCFSLYYAGVLYPDGRDPLPLFNALSKVIKNDNINVEVVFQGAGDGSSFNGALADLGLTDNVKFIDGVPFEQALCNMCQADALLLIQDEKFNNQVPGKIYEYLRTNNAVFLKTPSDSATCKEADGYSNVWNGYSEDELYAALCDMIAKYNKSDKNLHCDRDVSQHSREGKAARLLDVCCSLTSSANGIAPK